MNELNYCSEAIPIRFIIELDKLLRAAVEWLKERKDK